MKLIRATVVMCTASLLLGGCASFNRAKPAPHESQPMKVQFTTTDLSGWSDLPMGTYRVPDSQVIISGHQKGGAGPALLFGVVGMAVQSAVNSNAGKNTTKDAGDALRISLTSQAQGVADAMIAGDPFAKSFSSDANPAAPTLAVSSAVIMTFVNDTDVLPYVVLKATLTEPKATAPKWTTRYIASAGLPRPLTGDHSWTSDGGKELRSTSTVELQRAIRFMLLDVASPYPRDDNKLTMVQGHFPFIKQRLETVGYELAEDQQSISFVPKLGDVMVFSGVNIMEKSATLYRAAEKSDPRFKALDD
jgi:hypothetical protein